jgi:hypothetical protein
MRRLIGESVDITDIDLPKIPGDEQAVNAVRQNMLAELRDSAIKSYIEGMKKQMKVKVNQQLIG